MLLELPIQKPPTQHPVQNLVLYVTKDCNLRCTYCFVKKEPHHMSSEVARKSIDYLLQPSISGKLPHLDVSFFGGEPMLRTGLIREVIDHCRSSPRGRERKWSFHATTNCTLAGPEVEKVIRDGQIALLLSLDGDREASRNRPMLSGAESYDKVAKNLRKLVKWSPLAAARITYTPQNMDLLKQARHAVELGAPWVYLCPVIEADWSGCEEALEEHHTALGDWFIAEIKSGRIPPLGQTWNFLREYIRGLRTGQRPGKPCPLGTQLIAVEPEGNVMPCHRHLNHPRDWMGTVDAKDFPEQRSVYTSIHSSAITDCQTCSARLVCGGGCRVVALEAGHGLLGVHPHHCLITRIHHRMAERVYQTLKENPLFRQSVKRPERLRGALRELSESSN